MLPGENLELYESGAFDPVISRTVVDIPADPGAYLLHLRLHQPRILRVGRLGEFSFAAGEYLYTGSACGPGGLRARLGRHLRGGGKPHWHIDSLRAAAEVTGYGYSLREKRLLGSGEGRGESTGVMVFPDP
jgi:hypothetical protein